MRENGKSYRATREREKNTCTNNIGVGVLLKALIYTAPIDSATEYLNITKRFKQPSCCTLRAQCNRFCALLWCKERETQQYAL